MKFNISKMLKTVQKEAIDHAPELLLAFGIGAGATTVVLTNEAAPKALETLDEIWTEENPDADCHPSISELKDEFTFIDRVKLTGKHYIAPAITGALSIGCLIGSNRVSAKKASVFATAYALSEAALKEYKEKVIEEVGEKKERDIREKIDRDKIKNDPPSNHETFFVSGDEILCYDAVGGRYFKSTLNKIEKVEIFLNRKLMNEMYVSVNEMYYEFGLRGTDLGNDLGWNMNHGEIKFKYTYQSDEDGRPCLVISYNVEPRYDYSKLM